jgi:hypothetical protein
MPLAVCR